MSATGKGWRRGLVAVVALGAVAAVVVAALIRPWERSEPPSTSAKSLQVLSPESGAVAPGVYLLGRTAPAAVYAVDSSDGLVLIDSGLEDGAPSVIAQLGELGLEVNRLRAVLLTHVHADHSLGARGLRAATGAKSAAMRSTAPGRSCAASRESTSARMVASPAQAWSR